MIRNDICNRQVILGYIHIQRKGIWEINVQPQEIDTIMHDINNRFDRQINASYMNRYTITNVKENRFDRQIILYKLFRQIDDIYDIRNKFDRQIIVNWMEKEIDKSIDRH